jgi:CBS domain-containing protein
MSANQQPPVAKVTRARDANLAMPVASALGRQPGRQSELQRRPPRILVHTRLSMLGDGTEVEEAIGHCPYCDRSLPLAAAVTPPEELPFERSGPDGFFRCGGVSLELPLAREDTLEATINEAVVSDVMTRDVLCAREDTSIQSLADVLLARGLSGAPVTSDKGRLVGYAAMTDIARAMTEGGVVADETGVGEIMTPAAYAISERTPLAQAAALMAYEAVVRLPVVSDRGEVVGLLSALDIVRWLACRGGYHKSEWRHS